MDLYSVNGKTAGMIVGIWLVLFHMVLDVLNQKDQEFIPEFRNSKIGFRMSWITKVSRLLKASQFRAVIAFALGYLET